MPALKIFGQKLAMAGDDLRVLVIMHSIWTVLQATFASGLFVATIENDLELVENCYDEGTDEIVWAWLYATTSLILCFLTLCLAVPLFYFSGKGTPTDDSPRKPIKRLCYFDTIVMNTLRVAVFSLSIVLLPKVDKYCECLGDYAVADSFMDLIDVCGFAQWEFLVTYICLAVTHWIDIFFYGFTIISLTCCHHKLTANAKLKFVSSERKCSLLMKCCIGCTGIFTCGILGGDEAVRSDFANFSLLMANYLKANGRLNLTVSDIYVGLYMVALENRLKKIETKNRLRHDHGLVSKEHSKKKSCLSMRSESTLNSDNNRAEEEGKKMAIEVLSDGKVFESVQQKPIDMDAQSDKVERGGEKLATEMLSKLNSKEVDLINEAARFMILAESAYTIAGYMLRYPFTGSCSFFSLLLRNCACFSTARSDHIEKDNGCRSHTIALKALSGLTDKDIVYAYYRDTVEEIPYMILLDHEWKSIVISIRGTMTLESAVTDFNVSPKKLTIEDLGEESESDGVEKYCHTGMLSTAKWLYKDMKKHSKLEKAMADYEGYKLRIIGHSLGAGVASILSVLLRPKYPCLHCLAFSPPGCTMSENLAIETEKFTTSFVVNDDIIARLNVENFEELRDRVLEMIYRIKIPKYQVTNLVKKYDDYSVEGISRAIDEILYKKEEINDSQFKREVEEFLTNQSRIKAENRDQYIKLCPPGSLVQLVRTDDVVNAHGEKLGQHVARWAKRSDFANIELSSKFFADHETSGVTDKLRLLAEESFALLPPFKPLRTQA